MRTLRYLIATPTILVVKAYCAANFFTNMSKAHIVSDGTTASALTDSFITVGRSFDPSGTSWAGRAR